MRFLTVDSKNNIIHSSGSIVSAEKFTVNAENPSQINGQPAIGKLSIVPFSTRRGKHAKK